MNSTAYLYSVQRQVHVYFGQNKIADERNLNVPENF